MSQKFSLYEDLTVLENIRFLWGYLWIYRQNIKEKTNALFDELGSAERSR